jgi:hypothetical protein
MGDTSVLFFANRRGVSSLSLLFLVFEVLDEVLLKRVMHVVGDDVEVRVDFGEAVGLEFEPEEVET